jgi:hypothetical protein
MTVSKIFVFGFDNYYPCGGMTDLIAVLQEEGGERIGSDMLILPGELAKVVGKTTCDYYQVLHFAEDGAPLLVERWRRASSPGRPGDYDKELKLPDGFWLLLDQIVSDFADKLVGGA